MVATNIQMPLEAQGSLDDADKIAASSHGGFIVIVMGGIPLAVGNSTSSNVAYLLRS